MKVIIDDVVWWPKPTVSSDSRVVQALELEVESNDAGENLTIRDYLRRLLETLWEEREGFSGKRPFGNSGWEYDLYEPLVKAGLIKGKMDEEGFLEDPDFEAGDELIMECIKACFNGSASRQ